MASEIGVAWVTIAPSAKGFRRALEREIGSDLTRAGRDGGEDYGKAFERSAGVQAKRAGSTFSKVFGKSIKPTTIKVSAETAQARAEIAKLEKSIRDANTTQLRAADSLTAAKGREADAVGQVRVAEQKLTEVRGNSRAKASQIAAAEERLAKARRSLESARKSALLSTAEIQSSNADITSQTRRLEALRLEAERLDGKDVSFNVNARGAASTAGFLDRSSLSLKQMGIFAGGAAISLAPVAAHAAGIAASLAVPVAAGAGGLTVFGLIAGQAIKTTQEQAKEIEQTKEKLSGLEKGTKDYKETLVEYKAMLRNFSPAQQSFIDKQGELKQTFNDLLQGESGRDIFRPITRGMGVLNDALPQTKPLLRAVSRSITSIVDETGQWVNSGSFDKFLGFFEQGSGPAIKTTWRMLKNVGSSIGNIVGAIGGQGRGQETLEWLEGLTKKWRRWSAQADEKDHPIQRFVRWMDKSGPEVGQSLVKIGEAVAPLVPKVVRLGEALLPIAADVLPPFAKVLGFASDALSKFLEVFNKLPPALQTALIAGRLAGLSPVGLIRGGMRGGGFGMPMVIGGGRGDSPGGGGRHRAPGRFSGMRGGGGLGTAAAITGIPIAFEGLRGLQGLIEQEPALSSIRRSIDQMARQGAGKLPGDFNDLGNSITKLTSDHWWDELDRSMGMFDQQKEEIRGLDRSLVAIAERRGLPAARRAFRQVAKSEELTADQTNRLMNLLPGFRKQVEKSTPSLQELTRGWNRMSNLLALKVIPRTNKIGEQFNLNRRQAKRLQGAIADSVTGDKKHERQLRHVASALGLNQREVRQLVNRYGNQENWVRQLTRANRKHDDGLRDIGRSLGLTQRETKQLTGRLKDEEAQNRRTTGSSKLHEKQLKEVAEKLGLNQRETKQMIRQYKNVPERVDTRAEFFTNEAERKRDAFLRETKGKFADLGNNTYAIMVDGRSGHGRIPEADGGIVEYASGGVHTSTGAHVPRVPQIVKGRGRGIQWGEQETGWEAYISGKPAMRERNRGVLSEAAKRLGMTEFADGGFSGNLNTKVKLDMSEAARAVQALIASLRSRGGSVPATLAWARRQVGADYTWGGHGPKGRGYDCSGFMSAITNHLMGRNPYGERFATGSFPAWGAFRRGPGIFMIGSTTNAGGGVGHMAGTLGGVNVESSGGVGVRVGGGARGAKNPMFNGNVWHLKPGLIKRQITGGGGGDAGVGDMRGRSPAAARAYARDRARNQYGWGRRHFGGLNSLWEHESNWRWNADNPTSPAYGIPQANPGSKMASKGRDWRTNPATQIDWGLEYINTGNYGSAPFRSPLGAWQYWRHHGHYADGGIRLGKFDRGGDLRPGYTLSYNGTGKNETVRTHEQERDLQVRLRDDRRNGRQRLVFDRDSQGELLAYIEEVADHRITRDRLHR